jgi:ATP:ADP antiporter, AAA family
MELNRFVDLRQGESRPALGAFAALFGIVAGHTILETARDALFLSKLAPDKLTNVYVAVALATLLVSSWNARFVRHVGQRNALVFTLVVAAYVTALLHFQPMTMTVLFLLYAWSGLIGTVLGLQFWMFAVQIFTVAQGKRLFGPIASGGVVGAVVGASGAAAVVARLPVTGLLLVAAGIFLATAVFLTTVSVGETRTAVPEQDDRSDGIFALLREVPYLRQLATVTGLATATLLVTDYLFKSVAYARVPQEELGTFFARTYAALNLVSLVVQLLLAGRILRGLGVVPALVVLPLAVAMGSGSVVIFGGLLGLAFISKGADGALRYSLHRVASELLWMPLTSDVRDRAKSLLDSVFGKVTQAVVAGLLMLLVPLGLNTPRVLAGIALGLSALWVSATLLLRSSYIDLFRRALSKGAVDLPHGVEELDLSSVEAVLEALSSRDAPRVIAAMELLAERKRSRLIPGLILYHEAEPVLVRALELVATSDRRDWIPLAERLLANGSETVRVATVRALARAGELEQVRLAMKDESPQVRAHAALSMASCEDASASSEADLGALLGDSTAQGRFVKLALLDATADRPDPRWNDLVLELAAKGDDEVRARAPHAMARMKDARFVPFLVPRLASRDGRAAVRDALVAQGDAALDALAAALDDPDTHPMVRLHIPRTISRFSNQRAANLLTDLVINEPRGFVRYKALRGLGRLVAESQVKVDKARIEGEVQRNLVEYLRLLSLEVPLSEPGTARASAKLVVGLLSDKRRQALERAFRLLQIMNKHEDIRSVHAALLTADKRLRAQAMEFLDALTATPPRRGVRGVAPFRGETRELFGVVADDLPDRERVARSRQFLDEVPEGRDQALTLLLRERDDTLATLTAYAALEIGTPELLELVAEVCELRPTLVIATPLASRRRSRPPPPRAEGAREGA